jgi:hypothetical protein
MAATDDSENLLDHLTERINPNGWRVISNPTRQPEPEADDLKTTDPNDARGAASTRKAKSRRD